MTMPDIHSLVDSGRSLQHCAFVYRHQKGDRFVGYLWRATMNIQPDDEDTGEEKVAEEFFDSAPEAVLDLRLKTGLEINVWYDVPAHPLGIDARQTLVCGAVVEHGG
jgi:hypothetical protein